MPVHSYVQLCKLRKMAILRNDAQLSNVQSIPPPGGSTVGWQTSQSIIENFGSHLWKIKIDLHSANAGPE